MKSTSITRHPASDSLRSGASRSVFGAAPRAALFVAALLSLSAALGCEDDDGDSGANHSTGSSSSTGGTSSGGGSSSGGAASGGTATGGTSVECAADVNCQLEPLPSTGDIRQDCVNRVNQFRKACLCLEPLERWTEAEGCADQQAEYDITGGPHAGFRDDICEPSGWGQNECPGYDSESQVIGLCLQQMWSEGPPPQEECEGQCFQEHGHFINMTNPSHTKVACGFANASDGSLWAVQNYGN